MNERYHYEKDLSFHRIIEGVGLDLGHLMMVWNKLVQRYSWTQTLSNNKYNYIRHTKQFMGQCLKK
jgi:hypothetical protein